MSSNSAGVKIANYTIEKIKESIENGTPILPWHKPWKTPGPINLSTKKYYRGMNWFVLMFSDLSPSVWVTHKQAKQLGGFVKARPKDLDKDQFWGIPVYYYGTFVPQTEKEGETSRKQIPFIKLSYVFNAVHQCEGLDEHVQKITTTNDNQVLPSCEMIVDAMPLSPQIKTSIDRAYYVPSQDSVHIPLLEFFDSSEHYYSTLFHELVHSTGHPTRLDRPDIMLPSFGTDPYAREELVAEFGASMLCARVGIEERVVDNSISYIQSWLSRLKNDPSLLIPSASAAQKAVDFITGELNPKEKAQSTENDTIVI